MGQLNIDNSPLTRQATLEQAQLKAPQTLHLFLLLTDNEAAKGKCKCDNKINRELVETAC